MHFHRGKCTSLLLKLEMETTESLRVTNNGNSKAFYKWLKQPD